MSGPNAWEYFTRTIPAWSVCICITVLVFSFIIHPFGEGANGHHQGAATPWQIVLSFWMVLMHIMSIVFPARVCYAMGDVIQKMKAEAVVKDSPKRRKTLTVKTEKGPLTLPVPVFVIILPVYKENMSTLEETLRVLASHPQARTSYHLYLAMEEREEKAEVKAQTLLASFQRSFYKMSYTIHPAGIPGEAPGKSSNESWAGKQACKDYALEEVKRNVIMTIMDADTHFSPRYFSQVARAHLENPETNDTTIYVPPNVFDRNLHHVPLPVRTADIMWAGAGISSLYEGSTVCIPTSVYSLPMTLVDTVGGWDTGPGAIGEDMHMYLKCFFALSGNLNVKVIYAAASHCNVSSDLQGLSGYMEGLNARYNQALRHMWGALDSGFAIRQAFKMVERHRTASQARHNFPLSAPKYAISDATRLLQKGLLTACSSNWTAFYTSTGLHKSLSPKLANAEPVPPKPIHILNVLTIFVRLFEAHFLPIHLATILTTSSIFTLLYPGFLIPNILRIAIDVSGWCRLAGWLLMLYFFHRYEEYHKLCVGMRQEEMRKAGMLEEMTEHDGFSPNVFRVAGLIESGLFPLGGFIFGAIPALQAVLSHVFTDRIVYVVSLKPQLGAIKRWRGLSQSSPISANFPKQAFQRFDHVTTTLRMNRPVERKD